MQRAARRRAYFAGIAALLAAAPTSARGQDLSCQPGDVEVRALAFTGNLAFSDRELAPWVLTTPSARFRRLRIPLGAKRCLNRQYLARDLTDLALFYRNRGYYEVQVDTIVRPLGRGAVGVAFNIVEGPPTILRRYTVRGLDGVRDSAAIVRNLRLHAGEPWDVSLFVADIDSIIRRLRNSGYYDANYLTTTDRIPDSLVAEAGITLLPGSVHRFGEPVFNIEPVNDDGQQVSDRIVQRVMGIAPGVLYSDRAILEAQRNLYQLGLYRNVAVEPLPESAQPAGDSLVVLDVRLAEDYTKRLDSEWGLATLDCGRVRLQYTDLNFARSARRFEVTGQASKIGYGAPLASDATRRLCSLNNSPLTEDPFSEDLHYFGGVSIRQPRLLGTAWVPALSLYSERRGEYKAYLRTTNIGTDLSLTRDVALRTQLRIGYSQEYGRTAAPEATLCALFNRCDDASRANISETATLGIASATLARFTTDNPLTPSRGSIVRVEARTSASSLLGTSESLFFNKVSGDVAFFRPIGGNVASVRLRAGAVTGKTLADALAFIPPQERLYAGGATSIRGFPQNELGDAVYIARVTDVVRDTAPDRYSVPVGVPFERVVPLGGNALFVANFEYRVRDPFLFPNVLQYVFFVDGGDVWNRPDVPSFKWTPGIGFSASTPIGPIQFNVGYNRYARPNGPIFFEDPLRAASTTRPDISPLYCVSPGNTIDLVTIDGVLQPPPGSTCPRSYSPPQARRWTQRLTYTVSIGSVF